MHIGFEMERHDLHTGVAGRLPVGAKRSVRVLPLVEHDFSVGEAERADLCQRRGGHELWIKLEFVEQPMNIRLILPIPP
ncbi:MAG: hypothetical protein R2855_09735 [Thermomicrobiales bacterium]